MDEQIKDQFRSINDHFASIDHRISENESKFDGKLEEILRMMRNLKELGTGPSTNRTESSSNSQGEDQRVDLASLYMFDKAEIWVFNYLYVRKQVDWGEFVIDLSARFRDEVGHDVVEQFNKLQQFTSLEAYIDDFENLRSLLLQSNHTLPESYVLESFVEGLKGTVKPFVRAFKPTFVADAILYARLQEESLNNAQKLSKPNNSSLNSKPLFSTVNKTPILPTPQLKPVSQGFSKENQKPFKFIPAEVRAEKMAKGLCYYCDKKYERGHKCQFKEAQLFAVEIPCEEEENSIEEEELDETRQEEAHNKPSISVNALMGSHTFNTMRVQGWVQGKPLHILVDSGSTHNFLDIGTAHKLGCKKEGIRLQAVTVADGNHIPCQHVVKNFCWKLGGSNFTTDTLSIELGSCDMVLGIQWLSTLGNINWDFKKLVMELVFDDKVVKLKGIASQKLKKGIIQQSASPFASPVVLVGKKDGSWRLCVDYRELNKKTVKDKFPIPVVDELIDELSGSKVFSKIDLRAGYHQLRMHTEDVFKTTFKTHSGHYEFLVMPFGLTNAPTSFQGWMNAIFKCFLRKNVLVFFDDILIYNKSLEEH
ncbi:uncharacterized protein LOC141673210 [Apium graveolens]|uniref:uncharacterized protein LOC141673210 n=1 Tax=Apium graveolens TaxID=4045 RepID=UPI003D7B0422